MDGVEKSCTLCRSTPHVETGGEGGCCPLSPDCSQNASLANWCGKLSIRVLSRIGRRGRICTGNQQGLSLPGMLGSHHSPTERWCSRQESHLQPPGSKPGALILELREHKNGRHGRIRTDKPLLLRQRGMLDSRHMPLVAPAGLAPARLRSERSRLLLPHGAGNGAPARTSAGITGLGRPRSVF